MFAEKLKKQMVKAGINKTELAAKMGLTEKTIYNYMEGERDPKRWMVHSFAIILKCKIADLTD